MKKPVQVQPDLTRQRALSSPKLDLALQSNLIAKSSVEDLKKVLGFVMIKIGLRGQNFPEGEEKAMLIQHIVEHYGGNRIDEIKLAFDLAITGQLQCEVNCYENFSCLYFSSIMNSYRSWARLQVYFAQPEEKKFTKYENELFYCYVKQKELNKLPYKLNIK